MYYITGVDWEDSFQADIEEGLFTSQEEARKVCINKNLEILRNSDILENCLIFEPGYSENSLNYEKYLITDINKIAEIWADNENSYGYYYEKISIRD